MPNYKKRSTYQTGGTARTQYSTSDIAKYTRDKTTASERARMQQMNAMNEAAGRQALGNRQRAAAQRQAEAMRQRQQALARSRADAQNRAQEEAMRQRQAQSMRQREQQLAAMRQQRAPARAQDLRNTPRKLSPAQQRLMDSYNRGMAQRQQPRPQMRTPTPQELARLRANPNRPSMSNQVKTLNQGNALERQRIQKQIAQLQARLRQLGG